MVFKRGQVTIFIIVAILIVASAVMILLLVQTQKAVESPEVIDVREYVGACLQDVSKDAIISIGEQGGYYNLPEKTNYFSFFPKPYYIYETEDLVPGMQVLELEISKYIKDNIDFCLADFSVLEQKGYDVKKTGSNKISIRIVGSDNSVGITAKIPISVTKDNSTSLVNDFYTIVKPVRFDVLLRASNEIASSETRDPRTMCITCIQNIAESYGLQVTITETDDRNDFIYALADDQSNFTEFLYEYSFAAKYKFPDCSTTEDCFNKLV